MSEKVIPNVQNYSRMLQIQEGAVVSKTIINQKTGTITLFAFDKGEGLSEHAAPYDAFVEVTVKKYPARRVIEYRRITS